jgi:hypothetical protein
MNDTHGSGIVFLGGAIVPVEDPIHTQYMDEPGVLYVFDPARITLRGNVEYAPASPMTFGLAKQVNVGPRGGAHYQTTLLQLFENPMPDVLARVPALCDLLYQHISDRMKRHGCRIAVNIIPNYTSVAGPAHLIGGELVSRYQLNDYGLGALKFGEQEWTNSSKAVC